MPPATNNNTDQTAISLGYNTTSQLELRIMLSTTVKTLCKVRSVPVYLDFMPYINERGISLYDLADAMGVDVGKLVFWGRSSEVINVPLLNSLCWVLGCLPGDLLSPRSVPTTDNKPSSKLENLRKTPSIAVRTNIINYLDSQGIPLRELAPKMGMDEKALAHACSSRVHHHSLPMELISRLCAVLERLPGDLLTLQKEIDYIPCGVAKKALGTIHTLRVFPELIQRIPITTKRCMRGVRRGLSVLTRPNQDSRGVL